MNRWSSYYKLGNHKSSKEPSIRNEFAAALFRWGHSMQPNLLQSRNKFFQPTENRLLRWDHVIFYHQMIFSKIIRYLEQIGSILKCWPVNHLLVCSVVVWWSLVLILVQNGLMIQFISFFNQLEPNLELIWCRSIFSFGFWTKQVDFTYADKFDCTNESVDCYLSSKSSEVQNPCKAWAWSWNQFFHRS